MESRSAKTNLLWVLAIGLIVYGIHMSLYVMPWSYQVADDRNFSLHELTGDHQLYLVQTTNVAKRGPELFQNDPYLAEHSEDGFPRGNLVYLFGAIFLWIKDDINFLLFAAPFISVPMGVWLLYRSTKLNSVQWSWAVFGITVMLAYLASYRTFFYLPENLQIFAKGAEPDASLQANYNFRFPHAQITLVLLFYWFYRLQNFLKNPSVRTSLLLGLSIAILQYSYFYFWTASILFTALSILITFKQDKEWWKRVGIIAGTYIVLTLPYWVRFLDFNAQPFAEEYKVRLGSEFTKYNPRGYLETLIAVLLLGFDFIYHKVLERKESTEFSIRKVLMASSPQLILAATIVFWLNVQVIIGYTIQSYHWLFTFYHPILAIVLFTYLMRFRKLLQVLIPRRGKEIAFGSFVAVILIGLGSLYLIIDYYAEKKAPIVYLTDNEVGVIDYLRENAEEGSVIMSNDYRYLHTAQMKSLCRSYLPYSFLSVATNQEMLERGITGYRALGYTEAEILHGLEKGNGDVTEGKEVNVERFAVTTLLTWFTYTYKDLNIMDYHYTDEMKAMVKSTIAADLGSKYRLDYLIIRKEDFPTAWQRLSKVVLYENDDFLILKHN